MTHQWNAGEAVALQKALRLSGIRFAEKLGVSPRTVANWAANPDMVPRLGVQDALDELLAGASTNARARFGELTDRPRHDICKQPHPVDAKALYEAIDNLSARLSLLERLIAGPPITNLQATVEEISR